jgi:ribonuclease P protein component
MLPRSDSRSIPEPVAFQDESSGAELNFNYETTVSTVETSTPAAARILGAQVEEERSGYFAQSPPRGSQAPDARLKPAMPAAVPKPLKFSRAMRIKQGHDFSRIRQEGERRATGCLIANWRRLSTGSQPRLGLVTGSKIGDAVARSRARRLLREVFRVHQHDFTLPIDLVLIARPSIAGKAFSDVEQDFLTTLRRTGLIKE